MSNADLEFDEMFAVVVLNTIARVLFVAKGKHNEKQHQRWMSKNNTFLYTQHEAEGPPPILRKKPQPWIRLSHTCRFTYEISTTSIPLLGTGFLPIVSEKKTATQDSVKFEPDLSSNGQQQGRWSGSRPLSLTWSHHESIWLAGWWYV